MALTKMAQVQVLGWNGFLLFAPSSEAQIKPIVFAWHCGPVVKELYSFFTVYSVTESQIRSGMIHKRFVPNVSRIISRIPEENSFENPWAHTAVMAADPSVLAELGKYIGSIVILKYSASKYQTILSYLSFGYLYDNCYVMSINTQ